MYTIVFRVRTVYFDMVVSGEKTVEVRRYCDYWNTRAYGARWRLEEGEAVIAKFVNGDRRHCRWITSVQDYDTPDQVLGREPSEQAVLDIGTGRVWGFHLAEEILQEHRFHSPPTSV
jgi:ASC-1-like (ASCH) protein